MLDIEKIVQDKVSEMMKEDNVKEAIEKQIQESLLGAIKEAVGSYDVKRILKEKMVEQINPLLNNLSLDQYAEFSMNILEELLIKEMQEGTATKVREGFKDLVSSEKVFTSITEIAEAYEKHCNNSIDEYEKYDIEKYHASFDKDGKHDWWRLRLHNETLGQHTTPEYEVLFHKIDKKEEGEGSIFYLKNQNDKLLKTIHSHMSSFEKRLFNTYCKRTLVNFDIGEGEEVEIYPNVDR